ncbi:MAG TPA: adenylosuccinate synthetase [Nitrososphaeraceae archaeon]|nr:adenylosuccinate synthetase [Nitrososphaeraceae archaeon]
MPCTVIVGGFYGDEGKGKIVAYLARKDKADIAVRGGVGPNAGHTVMFHGKEHKTRMLPSALVSNQTRLMIGPGVLINVNVLLEEIKNFDTKDRTFIDPQCGIIDSTHIERDTSDPNLNRIGTTGTGTGPANADRALRKAFLAKDSFELSEYLQDIPSIVNSSIDSDKTVLIEGTQGTFLSLYHGTYPFVTSKDVSASAICSDVGIGPKKVSEVMVVFKAYVTRVGSGPLEGELEQEETTAKGWTEFGSVTGRLRRASPFNSELARRSIMLNSATQVALTKLDIVFPSDAGKREFNNLSNEAQLFVTKMEKEIGLKVAVIGTGQEVDDIIDRR